MDPGGFDGVFEAHASLVWSAIRAAGIPHDDAEDLFMKTWEAVWESLPSFSGRARLTTWITGIAKRKCFDYFRDRDRDRPAEPTEIERIEGAGVSPLPPRGGHLLAPPLQAAAREARQCISVALGALPPLQRTVVALWMRGFAYNTIAAVANRAGVGPVKPRRVGVLLIRARANLRRALKEAGIQALKDLV